MCGGGAIAREQTRTGKSQCYCISPYFSFIASFTEQTDNCVYSNVDVPSIPFM